MEQPTRYACITLEILLVCALQIHIIILQLTRQNFPNRLQILPDFRNLRLSPGPYSALYAHDQSFPVDHRRS